MFLFIVIVKCDKSILHCMDTKIALTCLVPVIDQIQNIRKQYDTAYTRWQPHFNIDCFPFFPQNMHDQLFPIIQSVCAKYKPINISLNKLDVFNVSGKKQGTLFANVTSTSTSMPNDLQNLYNKLLQALNLSCHRAFHPHVTLGRFDNQAQMISVKNQINWTPFNFTLDGLTLIMRTDSTPFVSTCFFPFGKTNFSKIGRQIGNIGNNVVNNVAQTNVIQNNAIQTNVAQNNAVQTNNSTFKVNMSTIGDYVIYKMHSPTIEKNQKIMNVLLIDNSGSMGNLTVNSTSIIGRGMFNIPSVNMIPGAVILFSDKAQIISTNICSANDIGKLRFPLQGKTNITDGIMTTINYIVNHALEYSHQNPNPNDQVHYIVTFLSDGEHNEGPNLTNSNIDEMREYITGLNIKLSVIVVGVTHNDTSLGMKIKTGLESITLNTLESVYYMNSISDMQNVLHNLTKGCTESLSSGVSVKLSVQDAQFVENMNNQMNYFVQNNECYVIVKKSSNVDPKLYINDSIVEMEIVEPTQNDITLVMNSIVAKLSQIKIAHGTKSIVERINILEKFITQATELFENISTPNMSSDQIGSINIKPADRLKMLKQLKQTCVMFATEKNKLKMLNAVVENDSSKQAEYLNGINKKYGAKAVLKANTMNISHDEVLNQLKAIKPELILAVENDKKLCNSSVTHDSSILSLNNALEEFEQWVSNLDTMTNADFDDIYSLLVCFGFPAYCVEFEHTNAVQMDPFQTKCKYIETCPIDTSTLMLSNQLKHKLMSPSHRQITDGLILVNPMCPNTSLLLTKTMIYQYLCSVALCRDLYMYSPKMTYSMHSHSLFKTIGEYTKNKSTNYLQFGIKILYSMKKHLDESKSYKNLFKHWFQDLNTITRSENDNCDHPVQLPILFGAFDMKDLNVELNEFNITTSLINLLNEVLAREMKFKLMFMDKTNNDANTDTKLVGLTLLKKLFGINETNSPKPSEDIMESEPTLTSVRESCQHWIDQELNPLILAKFTQHDLKTFVNEITMPYLQMFHFCLSIQKYFNEFGKNWNDVVMELERNNNVPVDLTEYITGQMETLENKQIYDYLNVKDPNLVAINMFSQAMLLHDSQSRQNVHEKNVLDSSTLQDIIVDLRMSVYFDACKIKKEKWMAIIGDVTFDSAFNGDSTVFSAMIGQHTHGVCKKQFWALLRAASFDETKKHIFLSKSNSCVEKCFKKLQ